MDHPLIGKSILLENDIKLSVIQMKQRDEGKIFVTYHVTQGNAIPRKLIMDLVEFEGTYGQLFK